MLALLIADDLTGACDAAVHFAARGVATRVCLRGNSADGEVIALSTETRDAAEPDIVSRMQTLASATRALHPGMIFKKIDSILRGRPGLEIGAALDAFDCELAIVTPAYPSLGRTVRHGLLHVDGIAIPIHVIEKLRADGLENCFHGSVAAAIDEGCRCVSVDAETEDDLHRLVAEALKLNKRILWTGSGGLASALADALCGNATETQSPARIGSPIIFCIGSTHEATSIQQRELIIERRATLLRADSCDPDAINSSLARSHHVVLRIIRGGTSEERVLTLLRCVKPSALFCCGGDTASLVLGAVGAAGIELRSEVVTGVPWGIICGGIMDGVAVATKSGGFGVPDTLIRTADFFTCLND